MPTSPFGLPGGWYRGNLHGHTTMSDGRFAPEEYADFYRGRGHDFTAVTDHRTITDMGRWSDKAFLCIPGTELDGPGPGAGGCDIVALGIDSVPPREELQSMQARIDAVRARGGVAIVAHPYETGLTSAELLAHEGYAGLEVWNTLSVVGWGKGHALVQWDELLTAGRVTCGFATDDCHHRADPPFDAGFGWVVVRAESLTVPSILAAIGDGRFYSSTGPELYDVAVAQGADGAGRQAVVRCSPCRRVNFLCDRGLGRSVNAEPGETLTEARFRLRSEATYLRVECVDAAGRSAWSNSLPLR